MLYRAFGQLVFLIALALPASAQIHPESLGIHCPGQWIAGGAAGWTCRCPDGSVASGFPPVCSGGGSSQPTGPHCGGGWYCSAGTTCCGSQCCNPGFYCSKYGCTPQGAVECGGYYCQSDEKCAIGRRGCLPADIVDCGPEVDGYCPEEHLCWTAPAEIPNEAKKGQTLCVTWEEKARLDKRVADLKREKNEAAERERLRKEQKEKERKEAERKAAEGRKRQEAEKKLDQEFAKQQDAESKVVLEASRARVEELRKALEGEQYIAPSLPQDWAIREIQAIAAGKDPQTVVLPGGTSATVTGRSARQEWVERQLAAYASGERKFGDPPVPLNAPPAAASSVVVPTGPAVRLQPYIAETRPVLGGGGAIPSSVFIPPAPTFSYSPSSVPLRIDSTTARNALPYALMSRAAYAEGDDQESPPVGYAYEADWKTVLENGGRSEVIDRYEKSGFSASIYRNPVSGEVVVAYRGSDKLLVRDFVTTNIPARLEDSPGSWPEEQQYVAAVDLANHVKSQYGGDITLTGHSLGGALASYAGNWGEFDVYTFNAARNPFSSFGKNDNQLNIIVPGDTFGDTEALGGDLTGSGKLPGQYLSVGSSTDTSGVLGHIYYGHAMDGIIGGLSDAARNK